MEILQAAKQKIPPANNNKVLVKRGETEDIINEVIECYQQSKYQLKDFAPHLKAASTIETLQNVWHFWKHNITYNQDPQGVQWVQEPKAFWSRSKHGNNEGGDCKSFSIAVMSSLYWLGIKAAFRFTNYNGSNAATHVYVVVKINGNEVPIDCVWHTFGTQKPYTKKWDYNMTAIHRLSDNVGLMPVQNQRGKLNIPVSEDDFVSEAEISLHLDKQTLELEQMISAKVNGIGGLHDNTYELEIMAHDAAIHEISGGKRGATKKVVGRKKPISPSKRKSGTALKAIKSAKAAPKQSKKTAKALKANNSSKGVSKKQAKILSKANVAVKKRKEGLLKKVGTAIKKGATAPIRLAIKTQLPKSAPFFLYTFIKDEKLIARLPAEVAAKRNKAMAIKSKLVDKLMMKESVFEKTIRNGIMSQLGKTPEKVLGEWMLQSGFTNLSNLAIGLLPIFSAAGGMLKGMLQKVLGNAQEDMEANAPALEDWGGVAQPAEMSKEIQAQPSNNDVEAGKGTVKPQTIEEYGNKYAADTTGSSSGADGGTDNFGPTSEDGNKEENKSDTTQPPTKEEPQGGGSNTMLYLGVAAVAALALLGSKKSK